MPASERDGKRGHNPGIEKQQGKAGRPGRYEDGSERSGEAGEGWVSPGKDGSGQGKDR